jgi:NADPH:quinone reductase-like Zn-dependent oxidoreductase
LSDAQAASLPVAGLTALKSLKYMIKLKPGYSVFINGASGGVGSFAVQIAKLLGARIAASCSAANMDFVKALGADEVYDYRITDVTRIKDEFDGFFDASAKLSFPRVQKLLKKTSVYVTTVPDIETTPYLLLTRALPGRKAHVVLAGSGPRVSEELSELAEMVVQGQIKPVLQETIALAQIAQGHLASEKEHAAGKTVVRIDSDQSTEW